MKKYIILILLLIAAIAYGFDTPPNSKDNQYLVFKNLLINGGFENDKSSWTASNGSTFTITTTAADVGLGARALAFDATTAGETITSTAQAIPKGLYGANGELTCSFKTTATDYKFQVYDGTNVVAEKTIAATSNYSYQSLNFVFPSSGNLSSRLISASNAAVLYGDDCQFSRATNVGTVSQAVIVASGYFAATTNCVWSLASASYTDFTSDADCPGPTSEFNPFGLLQTTDANLPQFTLNNMPPGDYAIYVDLGAGTAGAAANYAGVQLSDGTTASGAHEFYLNASDIFPVSFVSVFSYSTAANRTFKLQGKKAGATTLNIHSGTSWLGPRFVIKKLPSSVEQVYRPDVVAWRVDANIGGANPSLGTSTVTSYTEITNASLDMVKNTGSIDVQIPCSSTNASTGLTCSAGSESLGVVFNAPRSGAIMACFSFTNYHQVDSSADGVQSAFQIVQTPNNAQTILAEGNTRSNVYTYYSGSVIDLSRQTPQRNCGIFSVNAGQVTLRLMYEQAVVGTPVTSTVLADRDATVGQRDIHVEVYPIDQQIPAPLLVNSVVSPSSGVERIVRARFTNTGSCAVADQSGTWISSVSDPGTGQCQINIASGTFSSAPQCGGTLIQANGELVTYNAFTSNTLYFQTNNSSGTATDSGFQIVCMGPK